jgi:hypothetical protein
MLKFIEKIELLDFITIGDSVVITYWLDEIDNKTITVVNHRMRVNYDDQYVYEGRVSFHNIAHNIINTHIHKKVRIKHNNQSDDE